MNKVTPKLFIFVVFFGLFLMTLRPIEDPDFWWHLKTGELISESTIIPKTDPFSSTKLGEPWIAHEWLSELLMYQIFTLGGTTFLIIVFSFITTFSFFLIFLRCHGNPYIVGFLVVLSALASAPTWGVRPQSISLLLITILFLILDRYQENRDWKILISLPLVNLLWVNLHGSYIIGLVLICIFMFSEFIQLVTTYKEEKPISFRSLRSLVVVFIACLATTLINPNSYKIIIYPFTTFFSLSMMQYIQEWHSPDFQQIEWVPLAILIIILIAFPAIFRQPIKPVRLLLIVVFLFAALRSMRFTPLLAIFSIPFLADQSNEIYPLISQHRNKTIWINILNSFILLIIILIGTFYSVSVLNKQLLSEKTNFPEGAVEWIIKNKPTGNIYNTYSMGGYLIWRLYPKYLVYIDGRADIYGDAFINSYLETYMGNKGWEATLERNNISIVLLEKGAGLINELSSSPDWEIVYQDFSSILFVKKEPINISFVNTK